MPWKSMVLLRLNMSLVRNWAKFILALCGKLFVMKIGNRMNYIMRVSLLFLLPWTAQAAELVTLQTRPEVTQSLYLEKQETPVASVILFAGGHGRLKLKDDFGSVKIRKLRSNFLVRARNEFSLHGFTIAIVDAPSDYQRKKGMLGGFRNSEEHVTDMDAVIAYLRKQADVPVWLVGTSRGTESAANVALYSKQSPAGVILTSSMSVSNSMGTPLTEMAMDMLKIPAMVVAHENDECRKTPAKGSKKIMAMLTNSPRKELKMFSGGDEPVSKPCQARSYHGFLGIEEDVIDSIAVFIKAK